MRTARSNGTTAYSYTYNGGQLTQMTVGSDTLTFTYDASGNPQTVTYGGTTYYYVTNLQGDVIAILNSAGTKVVTYTYDAWGNILNSDEVATTTLGTLNPLRYRGYVYDHETGLYYLQSRYYDPEIGRFINADAFTSTGQGLLGNNMFAYCLNNPANGIDYSGMAAVYANLPVCFGGNGTIEKRPLSQNEKYMLEAGQEFDVDPVMIATVIAVEQNYNVNIFDLADVPAGLLGVDTSVGLGQVRITTAKRLEEEGYIELSSSHYDRVRRLENDRNNIRYVAAYLAYLRDIWILEDPDFEQHPDIWWTVYNTGKTKAHANPLPGQLSNAANAYYSYYQWLFG